MRVTGSGRCSDHIVGDSTARIYPCCVTHAGGWRRLWARYLFESRWFRVRQDGVALPDGTEIVYTMIEHPGFVVVVPVFDDGRVLLENLFRYTLQAHSLECPAGGLDGEPPEVA